MSNQAKVRRSTRRRGGGDTTDTDHTYDTDNEVASMMNVLAGDEL